MADDTESNPQAEAAALTTAVCLRLREIRVEKGLSIYRLARLTGLSERAIDFVEKGERVPTIDTIARIAVAMGVQVSQLIRDVEEI